MEKGFFNRYQKSPPPMTTRSGRVVSKPRPPAIDDHSIFPALSAGGGVSLKSALDLQSSPAALSSHGAAEKRDLGCGSSTALLPVVACAPVGQLQKPISDNGDSIPVLDSVAVSVAAQASQTWTSLFKNKPRNAGRYTSKNYPVGCVDGVLVPPTEVIDAGIAFWDNYLVGFFLDKNLSYHVVKNHLIRVWKLEGNVDILYDKDIFFFKFSCSEDRARILESDPYIIMNKAFIITTWCPSIDRVREQVRSIRVWVKLTNIPTLYQPLEGLDWLFGNIGKLVCFDDTTERRDRLEYAIALVEVTPDRLLPSSLSVYLSEHESAHVDVSYKWKPLICTVCKSFGHIASNCSHDPTSSVHPGASRVPLQKTAPRVWRAKATVTPSDIPLMNTVDNPILLPLVSANQSAISTPASPAGPLVNSDMTLETTNTTATSIGITPNTPTTSIDLSQVTTTFAPASASESNSFVALMSYLATAPTYHVDIPSDSMIPPTPSQTPLVEDDQAIVDLDVVYSIDEITPPHLRD